MAGVLASLLGSFLRRLFDVSSWLLILPFWLAWSVTWFILSHTWALAIAVAALTSLFVTWRYRNVTVSRRRGPDVQPPLVIPELLQSLPIQPRNGWSPEGVVQSLRVFSRFFSALSDCGMSVIGASTILEISPNQALQLIMDTSELHHWMGLLRAPVQRHSPSNPPPSLLKGGSDTIILTLHKRHWRYWRWAMAVHRRVSVILENHLPFLSSLVPTPPAVDFSFETVERNWYCQDDQVCYLFLRPCAPSSISFRWSVVLLSPVPQHKDLSVVTLMAMPLVAKWPAIQLLASQLCALRDHATMTELGVYHERVTLKTRLTFSPRSSLSPPPTPPSTPTKLAETSSPTEASSSAMVTMATALNRVPISHLVTNVSGVSIPARSQTMTGETHPSLPNSTSAHAHLDEQYLKMADTCARKLVTAASATKANGWTDMGVSKGVHIMKRLPQKGEAPINCVKGSTKICVPGEFVLRILMNPDHALELDDMLKEVKEIHTVSPTVQLLHLLYKAVWPTSARDFVVVSVAGRLDEQAFVHGAVSVVDPRVPETRGYVRGDVISGGYHIHDHPRERSCDVTYVTQVDLKGNVPTFVVNKVTESQPQCAAHLKKIAESRYSLLQGNAHLMQEFEEKFPISYICPPSPPLESPNDVNQTHSSPTEAGTNHGSLSPPAEEDAHKPAATAMGSQSQEPLESNNTAPNEGDWMSVTPVDSELDVEKRGFQETQDVFEASSTSPVPVSHLLGRLPRYDSQQGWEDSPMPIPRSPSVNSVMDYPRKEDGIDFRTLGNQTAARVLEEMFHTSGLDLENAATYTDQAEGWKFQSIEKDVLIMKKKPKDSQFNSFIGKGIIELSPQEVFNCIRNPNQRFIFDNMLKELHIVKQIEDGLYILHLHHETNQCFLKHSRDFCLLVCERSEHNKKLLVGTSIDVPECPPQPNITRGRILASGWMVEPCRRRGKLHTVLTYLVQTDIGGLPPTLVNFVSRRQPLAIAYLREYLYSTSLNREMKDDKESSVRWSGPRF